ncbi:MAG TPA: prolipoprotein diacylglyceryl transferase family protein [Pyrinomonadaceae bacterium]|nr:prolipoprotein diacylglyceryl transferase family protein [Pyrinomonadaceae bacterium]
MSLSTTLNLGRTVILRPSPFKQWAYAGLVLGIAVTIALTMYLRLSVALSVAIVVAAILIFLVRRLISVWTCRGHQLVSYHYLIAVCAVAALIAWLSGRPVLPYVDVTVMGFALFIAVGRIGCLMVGCCHGRPSRFGVCYHARDVTAAFDERFLGVRLFPIQALESVWLFFVAVAGGLLIRTEDQPGAVLVWFIILYCPARFFFEFLRWRPASAFFLGLSEAQWTSLLLLTLPILLILKVL